MANATDSFDAIILGTGVTESILSAALSRNGKTVLHLDDADVYGSHYAALNLRALLTFLHGATLTSARKPEVSKAFRNIEINVHAPQQPPVPEPESDTFHRKTVDWLSRHPDLLPVATHILLSPTTHGSSDAPSRAVMHEHLTNPSSDQAINDTVTRKIHVLMDLLQQHRQWSIELTPKVFLSRGDMVELLISSGGSRYVEFKALEAVYISSDLGTSRVPASKEDVFANPSVPLVEKRHLMRFMTSALNLLDHPDEISEDENCSFSEYLEIQRLGPKMRQVIIHALAMSDRADITTRAGLESTNRQLQSLGRFGRTAYLCALYGAGAELSQGFCRMSAVYGGTFMLNQHLQSISLESESWRVSRQGGTMSTARYLIASSAYSSLLSDSEPPSETITRLILILDGSIHSDSSLSVTVFPPSNADGYAIFGIQHSFDTNACPYGKFVLYLTTRADGGAAKEELFRAASRLVNIAGAVDATKPNCLLSILYNQTHLIAPPLPPSFSPLSSVLYCSTADASLDLDSHVGEAQRIFRLVCGEGAEFLPQSPAPVDDDVAN
ncbi:hypothetical protein SeMB42_g02617 [Synchytrium endobioticum]|uniref:Rab proteins geranylgeranyltransferase component n=1 Tax=Synchytrium endobioticum TaxID=286115 RepID=A0A507DCV2_9FUNG|nr:hypothetical protein SeLEV6574_g04617 [Synchytrium endobioticum]TPX49393.1 hypothetical protein SeMB42_g02617 [Synchytrium endobioticum]